MQLAPDNRTLEDFAKKPNPLDGALAAPSNIDAMLNTIDYSAANDAEYIPSTFGLDFVNFIKMVNGEDGEEHKTPVIHYRMLDQIQGTTANIANMCSRGLAKTTLLGEYLFLYIAVYGKIPGFGKINLALYVSDSIENGVKNMRKNLEFRWENSEFLQYYLPKVVTDPKTGETKAGTKFTDTRWEFANRDGNRFIVKGYGAKTGVRGAKEMGVRPQLAVLDDLISDEDARSATVIASVEDTVYKAVDYALHPTKSKTIWSGTPFNAKDPLYKAVESGAWAVNVYPVCEQFPCAKEDFRGAWGDRFTYEYVLSKYEKAKKAGKLDTFNQELMLRIMSAEDRLIDDGDIVWYNRANILQKKHLYNFYITTDFATSEKTASDFSVISVWAYNSEGYWMWVDGVCKKQLMDKNLEDLFRLVQIWKPQGVGVEVSGQQGGFIRWIQDKMIEKNLFFTLTSDSNENAPGIRPTTDKMVRFNVVLPQFKLKRVWFPEDLKDTPELQEAINELTLASVKGFKSKHDDFIDTISMLGVMNPWKPSGAGSTEVTVDVDHALNRWPDEEDDDDITGMDHYIP